MQQITIFVTEMVKIFQVYTGCSKKLCPVNVFAVEELKIISVFT